MLNQRRFIVGAVLIAAAASYLGYAGIKTTSVYYFEMDEFVARRANHAGEDLRVKGWVKQGTMQWDAATNRLAFDLSRKDGSEPVPVAYTGILPDMFAEGREDEFERKTRGETYQQIAAAGGGILSSVRGVRSASDEELTRRGRGPGER